MLWWICRTTLRLGKKRDPQYCGTGQLVVIWASNQAICGIGKNILGDHNTPTRYFEITIYRNLTDVFGYRNVDIMTL